MDYSVVTIAMRAAAKVMLSVFVSCVFLTDLVDLTKKGTAIKLTRTCDFKSAKRNRLMDAETHS